jgi:hypothetical protein
MVMDWTGSYPEEDRNISIILDILECGHLENQEVQKRMLD